MCIHLEFDHKKATQGLNFYAIKSSGFINKMKAIKLMYFADRYHLRKYGRPITNDEYIAMSYGPVNSGVKDIAEESEFLGDSEKDYADKFIRKMDHYNYKSIKEVDEDIFSESDIEALKFAWDKFGKYDQFELAELTHKYPEWEKHKIALESSTRVHMDYKDFIEDPEDGEIEKCYELTPEEKEDQKEHLQEMHAIDSLWS